MAAEAVERVGGDEDDRQLIRRAADGDVRSLEQLYQRHVDRVYALCLRMTGDERAAEELTQDVWVRVWRKLDGFRAEAAFTTWLYRVTANLVRDRARRRGRRDERTTSLPDEPMAGEGPRPVEYRLVLEAAIRELPERARHVFVLHDVQGFPHAEVAERLGMAEGTSKSHLHRARRLLRAELEREDGR